jgi:peptide deformylase
MKSLGIRTFGDPVLRKKSEPIQEFGAEIAPLFERMNETMIVERGVGLAANQVGIARRIAVMNPEPDNDKALIRMANPRIVATSEELETVEEGCLSVPGIRGEVTRHRWVEVAYQDETGKEHRLRAEGLLARIVQHEIDHLNGVLFVDRLSLAKRALIKPKLKNLKKGDRET